MPTPIGTNEVTSLSRRYILPEIVDVIYSSNPFFFRMNRAKRIVPGGTQIELPLMFQRPGTGGPYQGYDQLDVAPSDNVKNLAWDWKQHYTHVTVDGLTLIKTDSPQAIANHLRFKFEEAEMHMLANLGVGLWSDGVTNGKEIDGLESVVDDGGVASNYGGLVRSSNTFLNAQEDTSTTTLSLSALQSHFGNVSEAGRHPTSIWSRQEQYNRYWALVQANQDFPVAAGGHDEQLASAGFTNILFNNVPWIVDSNVFDGPNSSNSAIVMLTEDYLYWFVSPRADFYLEDFIVPSNQDAMVAKLLWAGNLACGNPQRQGKMTAVTG